MFSTWVPMSPTQSDFPVTFGSPRQACLLVEAIALERRGEPLLRVLGVHEAELAEVAAGDHLPRIFTAG